jgi:UDP-glucose 4-epimerase
MPSRKVLITGATGLIGSHLLRGLCSDDHVYAVSRSGSVSSATETIALDLGQPWKIADLPRDVDVIIHLAQSEHYRDFPQRADDVFAVNTLATVKLLDFARITGVKQFVFASTGGVYGSGADSFSEEQAIAAKGELGFYVGTRLCSEIVSECYQNWMNVICLRFFFVYGQGQRPNMLVPRLIDSVRTGRAIQLRGDAGLSINPVHVSDAVIAVRNATKLSGSHKLNVAGPDVLSLRQIAEIIGEEVGRQPAFEVSASEGDIDLIGDITRMRVRLHDPAIRFREGVRTLLAVTP